MGRDIHFYVEQRTSDGWRRVEEPILSRDGLVECAVCRGSGALVDGLLYHEPDAERVCPGTPGRLGLPRRRSWLDWRNYLLFAILGASNGPGRHLRFYDHHTDFDVDIDPIAGPRGLPADVSAEVAFAAQQWDGDGHTHSHLTVGELLAYDWDRSTPHIGIADPAHHTIHDSTSGLSTGEVEQRSLFTGGLARDDESDEVRWREPYWQNVPRHLIGTMLRMARLAGDNLDSVRCIYWFDN